MPTIVTRGAASARGFGFVDAGPAKPIYISNATTVTTADTTITINKPTSVSFGNLLVAFIVHNDTNWSQRYTTLPSGWNQGTAPSTIDNGGGSFQAFYKVAGGSEPASYTWSGAATSKQQTGIIINYSNAAWDTASRSIRYQVAPTITLTPDPSSLTVAKNNSIVFYAAASEDANKSISAPSGYSTLVSQLGGSTQGGAQWVFYKEDVAAGNSGSPTTTLTTTGQGYVLMAVINPA